MGEILYKGRSLNTTPEDICYENEARNMRVGDAGGKNLIPYPYSNKSGNYNGVEITINDDYSISVNGTNTGGRNDFGFAGISRISDIPYMVSLKEGKSYTLSLEFFRGSLPDTSDVVINGWNDNSVVMLLAVCDSSVTSFTFTVPADSGIKHGCVYLQNKSGTVFDNVRLRPMLTEGKKVVPYERYVPSVKMLTEEVSAHNESLSVIGKCKNLLNPTLQTTTQNGVTCTNNGDGTYTLNGTATKNVDLVVGKVDTIIGNKYLFCGVPDSISNSAFATSCLVITYENWITVGNGVLIKNAERSITEFAIHVNAGITVDNAIFKPMITTDLNATYDDFVPYTGDGDTLTADVGKLKSDLGGIDISSGVTALAAFKIDSIDLKLRGNHVSGNIVVSLQSGGVFRDSYVLQIPKEYAPKFKTPITANGYLNSDTKYLPGYGIIGTDGKVLFYSNNETNINIAYISFSYNI